MRMGMIALGLGLAIAGGSVIGCSDKAAPRSENARQNLQERSRMTLAAMKRADASLDAVLTDAYGYVIFPDATKGGLILGAEFGRGEVYEKGQFVGYAKLERGSVGAQVGGQTFNELIIFKTMDAMDSFKKNKLSPSATASAVILKAGASATAPFKDGVATIIYGEGGAMLQADIGAQKLTFESASSRNTEY